MRYVTETRMMYLDVRGTAEETARQLAEMVSCLREICNGERVLSTQIVPASVAPACDAMRKYRMDELLGNRPRFISFARDSSISDSEDEMIAANLVRLLAPYGVKMERVVGHSALQAMSCHVQQDFGVILKRDEKFVYVFDCASFEKTPKDPVSGLNHFVGQDIAAFHGRAKTHGHVMPMVMHNLADALSRHALDMLIIDLNGAGRYTDGTIVVRRFERNYVVPMWDNGRFAGMIVFADPFFQNETESADPFCGGGFVSVTGPGEFHKRFHLITKGGMV